jgi:hypothetical protein
VVHSGLKMFPSSAIRVLERTPLKLIVASPPYYSAGTSFILLSLLTAVFLIYVGRKKPNQGERPLWPTLLLIGPFFAVGAGLLTSRTLATLSRDTGELTVERRFFGVPLNDVKVPLEDLRYATVEAGRGSRRLVLICQSGRVVSIGAFTDRGGQYAAANAINDFLGSHDPR